MSCRIKCRALAWRDSFRPEFEFQDKSLNIFISLCTYEYKILFISYPIKEDAFVMVM
jgi:hypothetical protein